jgi:hypothetical protein
MGEVGIVVSHPTLIAALSLFQQWRSQLGAIPQGLKPIVFPGFFGTTEVVP